MTSTPTPGLRELIAATVREVVTDMVGDSVRSALTEREGTPPNSLPPGSTTIPAVSSHVEERGRSRTGRVRIDDDADLDAFARHLLELFENPKSRQDLRAGRLRFTLSRTPATTPPASASRRRIDTGAVTERQVLTAADAGESLLLGRRAVLTPLAREKARALGVAIEKER